MTEALRVERTYPHPPSLVWRALTERELLARWLMPNDFAPVVGRRFQFRTDAAPGFDGVVRCEVLEVEPEQRLRYTWVGGPIDTVVTFELAPAGEGATRLSVTQEGFAGVKGALVRMILGMGTKKMYGRLLPDLLDELAGGPTASDHRAPACNGAWSRVTARLAHIFGGPGGAAGTRSRSK